VFATLQFYSDDTYAVSTDTCASRGDAVVAAANAFEAEPDAVLMRVTLVTPQPDGSHATRDLTSDVRALLAWRADVRARHPETVGA